MRRERAYIELKRALLLGEFPAGVRLVEKQLAASLGISRTPVREALLQLTAEGLLQSHPRDGFWPYVPDLERIRQLYETRIALERKALERPAEWSSEHDAAQLEALRARWQVLTIDPPAPDMSFVVLDEEFHVKLAESSGNLALTAFLQMVHERLRLVRIHDALTRERVQATIYQHLRIVEALLDGDVPQAIAQLSAHLVDPMRLFLDRAARALARMASPPLALQA